MLTKRYLLVLSVSPEPHSRPGLKGFLHSQTRGLSRITAGNTPSMYRRDEPISPSPRIGPTFVEFHLLATLFIACPTQRQQQPQLHSSLTHNWVANISTPLFTYSLTSFIRTSSFQTSQVRMKMRCTNHSHTIHAVSSGHSLPQHWLTRTSRTMH